MKNIVVPVKLAVALVIGIPVGMALHTGSALIGFGIFLAAMVVGLVTAGITWLMTGEATPEEQAQDIEEIDNAACNVVGP